MAQREQMTRAEIAGLEVVGRHGVKRLPAERAVDQYNRRQIGREAVGRAEIVLRSRDQQAVNAACDRRLDAPRLRCDVILTGDHEDFVPRVGGKRLPMRNQARKEFVGEVRHHDADRLCMSAPQARCHVIGCVTQRIRGLHDERPTFPRWAATARRCATRA